MTSLAWQQTQSRLGQFLALTKPRVVSLIVFCAVIGMFLAVPFGACLYGAAQAPHAAEHRDWRRVRGDAAGAWLGGGNWRHHVSGALTVLDYFCMDAAAFLGARTVSQA